MVNRENGIEIEYFNPVSTQVNKQTDPGSCDFDPSAITVDQARAYIGNTVVAVQDIETPGLHSSLGRVTATDIISTSDVPNHTNSAMDGYAINSLDLPENGSRKLKITGASFAGAPFNRAVNPGECVRIMTGAVMPTGTDTVVMQEKVVIDGEQITISPGDKKGGNVRYAGEDIKAGDVVIPSGTRIGASQLGLLASSGYSQVPVFRKPKIAYFSNGDELRSVGTALQSGEVYDSNRYTLYAMLSSLNVDQIDLGVVKDDREAIAQTISEASKQADIVITTAGASVGDADYIKEVLARLGTVSFWKVAIKPGRPLSFGKLGSSLFFGLPGNPVSVMVTFQIFLKPAIRQISGEKYSAPMVLRMKTMTDLRKRPGRMEYQRGIMSLNDQGETVVVSTGEQGSGILSSMNQANCFIVLPDDSDGAIAGEWVEVQPFDQNS